MLVMVGRTSRRQSRSSRDWRRVQDRGAFARFIGMPVALVVLLMFMAVCGACGGPEAGPGDAMASPSAAAEPWVVWCDTRNATGGRGGLFDVYARDLSGAQERRLTQDLLLRSGPVVSWEWAVWSEFGRAQDSETLTPESFDIVALSLVTGLSRVICSAPGIQTEPAVSGDWAVWQDGRSGSAASPSVFDIYAFNIATGEERAICTEEGAQLSPDVSGKFVVWAGVSRAHGCDGDDFDIYARDLASGDELVVCSASGSQTKPAISDDWVVWQDLRGGRRRDQAAVYGFNLKTGAEKAIATSRRGQTEPSVSGDWVVWEEHEDGEDGGDAEKTISTSPSRDVVALNLATGERRVIVRARGDQHSPVVSGSWVVWQDERSARGADVFATNFETGEVRAVCVFDGAQVAPSISRD